MILSSLNCNIRGKLCHTYIYFQFFVLCFSFVFILCTQCCQASVWFCLMYPMLPGQCLFLSCVPNVARPVSVLSCVPDVVRPVSVFILCTQCCQASVCFYLVYPMLPGQCLFVSCVLNVARPVSVFIFCTQCYQASVCRL
jgi:hypothetical protein